MRNSEITINAIVIDCDKSLYKSIEQALSGFNMCIYWLEKLDNSNYKIDFGMLRQYICALGAISLMTDKNSSNDLIHNGIILSSQEVSILTAGIDTKTNNKSKKCRVCGHEYSTDGKFCIICGAPETDDDFEVSTQRNIGNGLNTNKTNVENPTGSIAGGGLIAASLAALAAITKENK